MKISTYSEYTFRITLYDQEKDYHNLSQTGILSNQIPQQEEVYELNGTEFSFLADRQLQILYAGDSISINILSNKDDQVLNLSWELEQKRIFLSTEDENLFGLGQSGMFYQRYGNFFNMVPGVFKPEVALFGSRLPIPFIINPVNGWALFIHQPIGVQFDLRDSTGKLECPGNKNSSNPVDLFLILDPDPLKILAEYNKLVGKTAMPPKWALGFMQSHRTLAGQDEVLEVAQKFREKELPCEALIYLGTGFSPSGWNTGHGSFDFNPKVFPQPKEQLRQLKDLNFKILLHVLDPPLNLYGDFSDQNISASDTSHLKNYWSLHQPLLEQSVDGFWPDMGDELMVKAKLARHRLYYRGMLNFNQEQRPFALHRTGYAGMRKYGGWIWSGDIYSTWETLKKQIMIGLNFSISGTPYWGTDIGGFVSTPEYSGELFVRWFQFGTFCPSFRAHGRNWHLHTPWGWNTGTIGPIENKNDTKGVGLPPKEEFKNPFVEDICRKFLHLRYQLLSYNYTLAWEAHQSGAPFMRPLWLYHPQDEIASLLDDQYYWGKNLLIAPVYQPKATSRQVYLPPGEWYDFWTNQKFQGQQQIIRFVGLETLPIYVRSGTILPFDPVRQYTEENVNQPLEIQIYTGADGNYTLYQDDGQSLNFQQKKYNLIHFSWNEEEQQLRIHSEQKGFDFTNNKFRIRLIPGEKTQSIEYHHETRIINF